MAEDEFYSSGPYAPAKKKADQPAYGVPALGKAVSPTVPRHPAKSSGLGGATHAAGRVPRPSHGFGHSVIQRLGSLRLSGHIGSHRLGKR